jgi:hypothetical protein
MDSQLPKINVLLSTFLVFLLFSSPCFAGEYDIDMFGFTYHLHRRGAVYDAPLKLDRPGVKVFNPGMGLGYDFRQDRETEGLSAIVHGGFFENCNNHPFSFAGAGARYRKYFHKHFYWETNVLGVLTYGNDSNDKRYKLVPMPYVNIGIGRDYGKYPITYYLSYVPQESGSGITSATDMLFLSAELSF